MGRKLPSLTVEHLWLTGSAMLFASAIGVPTGIWLTRHPRWAKPVLGVVNMIQTIPSLALFGFLLPLPWIGDRAARIAIVALTAYALLPIVRNTYTGIHAVDPAVIEVAEPIGYDQWPAAVESRAASRQWIHPSRPAHRNCARSRHCHHRGRGRRGRPGRVHLSGGGLGGQPAGAGGSDSRGAVGHWRGRLLAWLEGRCGFRGLGRDAIRWLAFCGASFLLAPFPPARRPALANW